MDVVAGPAAGGSATYDGTTYWFCNPACRRQFVASPDRYATPVRAAAPPPGAAEQIYTCPMHPQVRQ